MARLSTRSATGEALFVGLGRGDVGDGRKLVPLDFVDQPAVGRLSRQPEDARPCEGGRQRMQEEASREKTPEEQEREAEGRKRMWEMLDKGDPQNIGYMSEFFKLMQERRQERGLPPL